MDCRQLIVAVLLCCLPPPGAGRRKREKATLRFSDCGTDPHRPIRFLAVKAHPIPVIVPGTLYVTMAGNVTYDLPRRLTVELSIMKYIFGFAITVPCLKGRIGSCTYENICASLERFERRRCPRSLRRHGLPCHCPFRAGEFSVHDLPLNVPKVHGYAASLLNGDYRLTLSVYDEEHIQLGCLELKFSMKKRHRGWLFKI
ncbi:ganglioside GM2 activator-like [Babylonia areolata]|uniref:ganglioside GM2 activator-like n=1 Tax=Babylonia areolata TaxID=304850 RepID=UPI003FD6933D